MTLQILKDTQHAPFCPRLLFSKINQPRCLHPVFRWHIFKVLVRKFFLKFCLLFFTLETWGRASVELSLVNLKLVFNPYHLQFFFHPQAKYFQLLWESCYQRQKRKKRCFLLSWSHTDTLHSHFRTLPITGALSPRSHQCLSAQRGTPAPGILWLTFCGHIKFHGPTVIFTAETAWRLAQSRWKQPPKGSCFAGTHKQSSIFLRCPECFSFIQHQRLCPLGGNKWWDHFRHENRDLIGIWKADVLHPLIWGPLFFPLFQIDCPVVGCVFRFRSIYSLHFHPFP